MGGAPPSIGLKFGVFGEDIHQRPKAMSRGWSLHPKNLAENQGVFVNVLSLAPSVPVV